MKNLIEELYFGNLDPSTCYNKKTDGVTKIIDECEQKLEVILSEKEKHILNEYSDAQSQLLGNTSVENFTKGFRMGAVLMMDILCGEKLALD